MARVSIVRAGKDLEASVAGALESCGNKIIVSGDSVLIKPNLVEPADPESGQITTPGLVEAVARYCLDVGAKKVVIGEGPGYYQPDSFLRQCFTLTGVAEVAEKLGIPWVLFDEHRFRTFKAIPGCIARDFHVTEFAFNCDKIIDLPVLKTHWLTRITLGMKNLKGCLKWEDKPLFHRLDLERAVIELNKIVRPAVTIIDGTPQSITRQLSSGFSHWKDSNGGLIIAGMDIVATDAVGAALMGIDPSSVNLVSYGAEAGLGEGNLARIDIIGEELKHLEFKLRLPEEELHKSFPGLEILGGQKACCGCLIPLLSSLNSLIEKGTKSNRPLQIYIGEKTSNLDSRSSLIIGDCAGAEDAAITSVKGCPPAKDKILSVLSSMILVN
jgi:uncharacterized protein (DUF362 family)